MANPTWFDAKFYMASKLAQLQKADPEGKWDADKLQAAFDEAGYAGVEGAYAHYNEFSLTEGTNPNQYVNQGVYLTAKLAQMQKAEPEAGWTMDKIVEAFKAAGLSVGEHYAAFGPKEGLNPSNDFDNAKYMADKLAQLQKDDPKGEWDADKVQAAFDKEGLSPLDHYLLYGKDEGLTIKPVDDPIHAYNPGKEFALTTKVDTITGTDADDTITGVSSAIAKDGTLNSGDQIDGGAGLDTLKVDMKGSFNGFTGDGFMKNVENVDLTNGANITRTFNAKGIEGATTYNAKGAIDLAGVAAGVAVNLSDRASGTANIGYADKANDGTTDALTLGLNNVGTAQVKDASGKETTAQSAVKVNADGIETLNVVAAGANVVDLSGVAAATAVNAKGEGSLKVTDLAATVKAVDASAITGKVDLTLGKATNVKSVATGAGDDVINATAGNLTTDAEINGGAGADKLVLSGAIGTTQYAMSNVETVEFNGATSTIFSAKNVEGVENYVVKGVSNVKLADMGKADLNLTLSATAAVTGAQLTSDHTGNALVTVSGGTKTAPVTSNDTDLTFTKAGAVDLTVAAYNTMAGDITASEAASFTANVAGVLTDTVTLKAATSAVFNMTNTGTATTDASSVVLVADKATELQINTDAAFKLGAGTKLGALQNLTVDTDAAFDAAGANGTPLTFDKIANVTLSGTATGASAHLGVLGGATGLEYGINVEASGLTGGLTIDSITSDHNVTVNAADVKGTVTLGTFTEGKDVTVTGSTLAVNKMYVTADKATLSGGIGDDVFVIDSVTAGKSATDLFTATFSITGGLGNDKIAMHDDTMPNYARMIVSVTDYNKGDYTNYDGSFAKFADEGGKAQAVQVLKDAGIASNATAEAIGLVSVDLDGTGTKFGEAANYAFTYGGNTYLMAASENGGAEFGAKEVLIQLSGVQDTDSLTGFVKADPSA